MAGLGLATAHLAGAVAKSERPPEIADEPFAPSQAAAPFVALGYREVTADLLWMRLTGYFGGSESTANGVASLVEAITTLDPSFHRVYEWGSRAMTLARTGVDQSIYQRAIAVLEQGGKQFPEEWKLPYLEGQIYTQDLETKDPAQRRAWDERGTLLIESAIRKPHAPADAAEWAATMRTKLGEHQAAVDGLREMLLITTDDKARERLAKRLADLEHTDQQELAAELAEARRQAETAWLAERPTLPFTMYVLLGKRPRARFDLTDLATGGHDLLGEPDVQKLEPLE